MKVESSVGLRRENHQSSTTGGTYSTRPTTVSDLKSSKPYLNQPTIVQNRIPEEPEPFSRSEANQGNLGDGQSTISADSIVVLTPDQRNLIIQKFSDALLKDLPSKCLQPHSEPLENPAFRQFFNGYLKDYIKEVMEGTAKRSRKRQASKAIRLLRSDLLQRFQEAVGGFDVPEKNERISPSIIRQAMESGLREMSLEEKFRDWNVDCMMDCNNIINISTNQIQSDRFPDDIAVALSELDNDEESVARTAEDTSIIPNSKDQDVYSYLVEHRAFSTLIRNLQRVMEQHFGNQMELIRHRVFIALHRPGMIEKAADGVFRASFRTEWDPVVFLQDQYSDGHLQSLRHVLALTERAVNAQLTTVGCYLRQNWPKYTYLLIDKMSSTTCHRGGIQLCKVKRFPLSR